MISAGILLREDGKYLMTEKMQDTDNNEVKKHKGLLGKIVLSVAFVCIAVMIGFYIFAKNFDVVLPFDEEHMYAEKFQAAVVTTQNGQNLWMDVDSLDLYKNDSQEDSEDKIIIPEDYETLELVRICYGGLNYISSPRPIGRTVKRNGEEVWVVYYCYTKTLWDSLVDREEKEEYSEGLSRYDIYGEDYAAPDYEPKMREIYYLPEKNLLTLEELSDEEFDALRGGAVLVWSGVI